MVSFLESALGHVEREEWPKALDALIEAWSRERAPAIADAVDRVDAFLAAPALVDSAEQWRLAAAEVDARRRGPLLRSLGAMKMTDIASLLPVALEWDDPRVGTLILTMLRELRFSGRGAQSFWRDVFATLPRQRDPRYLELKATAVSTWKIGVMKDYLAKRLDEATEGLAPIALAGADERTVAKILSVMKARERAKETVSRGGTARTGAALLADIHANPSDDEPRTVYADWLLERNDPRGELIALQLRSDKSTQKREKELLKAHKKEWLGAIAPVVGGELAFRRGFLACATLKLKNQKDVEAFGSLPEWATLEQLDWGSQIVRIDQWAWSRWIGPAMRNVRVAIRPMAQHLLADDTIWAIEDLELWSTRPPWGTEPELDAVTYRRILASPNLPRLRRVFIMGGAEPSWLEGVSRCPPILEFRSRFGDKDHSAWLVAAARTEATTFVFDEYGGRRHRFTRDDEGKLTRLETIVVAPTKATSLTPPLAPVIEGLGKLPGGCLTHYDAWLEVGGERIRATEAIEAASRLVRAR